MDYITPIKKELEQELHSMCVLFCTIGNGTYESPRWMNFDRFDKETKQLTIANTQCPIRFTIDTPFEDIQVDEFWEQFKRFRTSFLQDNYPTIKTK